MKGDIMKTLMNKILAIGLIGIGIASWKLLDDGSFMIFTLMIGLPLFFAKKNWTTM
jgi:hypothetical protein